MYYTEGGSLTLFLSSCSLNSLSNSPPIILFDFPSYLFYSTLLCLHCLLLTNVPLSITHPSLIFGFHIPTTSSEEGLSDDSDFDIPAKKRPRKSNFSTFKGKFSEAPSAEAASHLHSRINQIPVIIHCLLLRTFGRDLRLSINYL